MNSLNELEEENENELYLKKEINQNFDVQKINLKNKNTLSYLYLNSEEYKRFKDKQKFDMIIKNINLEKSISNEVFNLSLYYSKLLKKRLNIIVPIVLFKLHKVKNISNDIGNFSDISLTGLKKKLNLNMKNYLKYEKFIQINTVNKKEDKINLNFLYENMTKFLSQIKGKILEKLKNNNNIIKLKKNKNNENLEKTVIEYKKYEGNSSFINEVENEIENIYNSCILFINELSNISNNNYNKICIKEEDEDNKNNTKINNLKEIIKKTEYVYLSLALFKFYTDKNDRILISYDLISKIFNISPKIIMRNITYIKCLI